MSTEADSWGWLEACFQSLFDKFWIPQKYYCVDWKTKTRKGKPRTFTLVLEKHRGFEFDSLSLETIQKWQDRLVLQTRMDSYASSLSRAFSSPLAPAQTLLLGCFSHFPRAKSFTGPHSCWSTAWTSSLCLCPQGQSLPAQPGGALKNEAWNTFHHRVILFSNLLEGTQ